MIKDIADLIVELSKEKNTGDPIRDIYSILMDVRLEVGKRMEQILEEKRKGT